MSKNNGELRHTNVLKDSSPDDVMLCRAVEGKFIELCQTWLGMRGEQLPIPDSLDQDFVKWRQFAVRIKGGDYRNTEAEIQSVKTIAQWTVDCVRQLKNQVPCKVEWKD